MQQFYRPNGDSTQKRGVIPDVVLPSLTNVIGMGEGDLDYAVDFDNIATAEFKSYNMVGADALVRLRGHSTDRIKTAGEFSKELARIARYRRLKDEKTISLNEEKYLARREAGKLPATNIWLWGLGKAPRLQSFREAYGKTGKMITAVDLLRGLAGLIGWDRIEVPGATGYTDTDYAAEGRYAIDA